MKDNNGPQLDKTSLAEEISSIIVKEIEEKKQNRKQTQFEKEIQGIMQIILSK